MRRGPPGIEREWAVTPVTAREAEEGENQTCLRDVIVQKCANPQPQRRSHGAGTQAEVGRWGRETGTASYTVRGESVLRVWFGFPELMDV